MLESDLHQTPYQKLSKNIDVPTEWPIQIWKDFFKELATWVIDNRHQNTLIIMRVNNVSAKLITVMDRGGPHYLFQKISHGVQAPTYTLDVILPQKDIEREDSSISKLKTPSASNTNRSDNASVSNSNRFDIASVSNSRTLGNPSEINLSNPEKAISRKVEIVSSSNASKLELVPVSNSIFEKSSDSNSSISENALISKCEEKVVTETMFQIHGVYAERSQTRITYYLIPRPKKAQTTHAPAQSKFGFEDTSATFKIPRQPNPHECRKNMESVTYETKIIVIPSKRNYLKMENKRKLKITMWLLWSTIMFFILVVIIYIICKS